jgi:hypothetical protein
MKRKRLGPRLGVAVGVGIIPQDQLNVNRRSTSRQSSTILIHTSWTRGLPPPNDLLLLLFVGVRSSSLLRSTIFADHIIVWGKPLGHRSSAKASLMDTVCT